MAPAATASLTRSELISAFGDPDIPAMSQAELIDLIEAAECVKSAAAAAQARATVELLQAARAERPMWRPERIVRAVASMVAFARRDSPRKGSDHVNLAKSLVDTLPETLQLMTEGKLSERRAATISKETRHLSPGDRREVDHEIATKLTGAGDRKVRDLTRSTADRVDPDGAARRIRAARRAGFVATYIEPDGTARLTTRLPFDKAIAVHRTLFAAAQEAAANGDQRLIGELMADLLAEQVLGACGTPVTVDIQLVMNERTLLRGSDEPAYVTGYGPIPGFLSRALVAEATKVWIRRIFTRPDTGELIAMESRRRGFSAGMRRAIVARDRTCRTPFCNAEIKHIDHRRPWSQRRRTEFRNGDGLCERCNYVKHDLGLRVDIIDNARLRGLALRTPTGHTYLAGSGAPTATERLRDLIDDQRTIGGGDCV